MVDNLFFQGLVKPTVTFPEAVAMGMVDGVSFLAKFGENPLVTELSAPEDVWEGGGVYEFSANGVADIVSLSSDDATDTQDVLITGLGVDGEEVTQIATLQGTTRIVLSTPLWRVYRMENWSFPGVSFAGTIYCYAGTEETDGVPDGASVKKAVVNNGNNQTQMAIYTVPAGKVAFFRRGEAGFGYSGGPSSGPVQVKFCIEVRTYNNVFKIKKTIYAISVGESSHKDIRPFPDPVPALSDVKICVKEASDDVQTYATFHAWIVDEELLTAEFLASIRQPGY